MIDMLTNYLIYGHVMVASLYCIPLHVCTNKYIMCVYYMYTYQVCMYICTQA